MREHAKGHKVSCPTPAPPSSNLPAPIIGRPAVVARRQSHGPPCEEGVDSRMSSTEVLDSQPAKKLEQLDGVVIRFCGDSGDGMQLVGGLLTDVSAAFGNDVSTLPDFPAEIRAPVGTLAGVSGFQLNFSSHDIYTPGDEVDTLVAMNPAALKTNLGDLRRGGTLIVNDDEFDKGNLQKAGYAINPLDSEDVVAKFTVHRVPMTRLTRDAVAGLGLSQKD